METTSFRDAIEQLGLKMQTLRAEDYLALSMNNRLINLNCNGLTWAGKVLFPYTSDAAEDFVAEKRRTIAVSNYLSSTFSAGIRIREDEKFLFNQRAFLADADSTLAFLTWQASEPPVTIEDRVRDRTLERAGIQIPGDLPDVPFLVQRGAPAKETLEDGIEFAELIVRGLCVLHWRTGLTQLADRVTAERQLSAVVETFERTASQWEPGEGKTEKKVRKYEARHNPAHSADVTRAIKNEVFLQTSGGNSALNEAIAEHLSPESLARDDQRAFSHGDAHGCNFIIVQYEYDFEREFEPLVDREYLNELFSASASVEQVAVELHEQQARVVFRPVDVSDDAGEILIAKRSPRREVHLIDVDTGSGVVEDERRSYLIDLVKLSVSTLHWSRILSGDERGPSDTVRSYYEQFSRLALR